MANATANRDEARQQGESRAYKAAAVRLYEGTLISLNTSGYATNASDTANEKFVGVARKEVDNSAGAAGDKDVLVWASGVVEVAAGWSAAQGDVGKQVYASDNQTVNLAANLTNDVLVGRIVEVVSASKVRVAITPDA